MLLRTRKHPILRRGQTPASALGKAQSCRLEQKETPIGPHSPAARDGGTDQGKGAGQQTALLILSLLTAAAVFPAKRRFLALVEKKIRHIRSKMSFGSTDSNGETPGLRTEVGHGGGLGGWTNLRKTALGKCFLNWLSTGSELGL